MLCFWIIFESSKWNLLDFCTLLHLHWSSGDLLWVCGEDSTERISLHSGGGGGAKSRHSSTGNLPKSQCSLAQWFKVQQSQHSLARWSLTRRSTLEAQEVLPLCIGAPMMATAILCFWATLPCQRCGHPLHLPLRQRCLSSALLGYPVLPALLVSSSALLWWSSALPRSPALLTLLCWDQDEIARWDPNYNFYHCPFANKLLRNLKIDI